MRLCVAPFKCLGLSPRQFSLKEWLMPVYFRKAKPFPRMGGGDRREGKRTRREEETEGDETDVWTADCETLQRCASRDEQEIIRNYYTVSKGHAGTSADLSHSMPWKESKYFSSRMYSVFIKQWITGVPWLPCGYCCAVEMPPVQAVI